MPTTATRIIKNCQTGEEVIETYEIPDPTPEELLEQEERQITEAMSKVSQAVQSHVDKTAQIFRYDGINSCSKYKDIVPDPEDPTYEIQLRYKTEANELLSWCAACWATVEMTLLSVQEGNRNFPTEEEMISLLPIFEV